MTEEQATRALTDEQLARMLERSLAYEEEAHAHEWEDKVWPTKEERHDRRDR